MFIWGIVFFLYVGLNTYAELKFLCSVLDYNQLQEENVIVFIRRFPCSLKCGDFHAHVCEAFISICNRWELEEFKTTCTLVFNRFGSL